MLTITVVTIVGIIIYVVVMYFLIREMDRNYKSHLYIYPKNGHEYYVNATIKMKSPDTGEWHDAVLYSNHKDRQTYVREYNDFFNKFEPVKKY